MIKNILYPLCVAGLFAGCASNTKQACESRDWKEYGRKEGRSGVAEDQVLGKEKSCSKAGIEIPIAEYKEGWLAGISEYCSPENAFELGKKKKETKAVNCPVEMRPAFDEHYAKGKELAGINNKISALEDRIESVEREKKNTRERMSKIDGRLKTLDNKESKLQAEKNSLLEKVNN